jgi:hypothetical protein
MDFGIKDKETSVSNYSQFKQTLNQNQAITDLRLIDHIDGFDKNYKNIMFDELSKVAEKNNKKIKINYHQILPMQVKNNYEQLDMIFDIQAQEYLILKNYSQFLYKEHHKVFTNFQCCFLGSGHVSRHFLSAILNKTRIWDNTVCSKNFSYTWESLDGNLSLYSAENERYFRKFFIDESNFNEKINVVSPYDHCDNLVNIYKIENIINSSFVHIIGETLGTSYVPFITEKFLQSIVNKGLFVTYGQPNWHSAIENQYGFKLYNKIFDYEFDQIENPVVRVVKLIEMISKFRHLSPLDWHDLYQMEQDTIEYNYDHYYSKQYLKHLEKFV